jgi:pyruvate dehydrogenase E2 component (dihydrolipoamide acetyltransferase)
MARIDVLMPQMGESIAEGTMSRWIKKVGDAVKRDEPIFEISTDKVDAEIPAPNAGVLAEVLVQEGETVAVGTIVARIETEAGASAPAPAPTEPKAPAATEAKAPPAAPAPAAPAAPAPAQASPAKEAAPASRPPHEAGPQTAEERLQQKSTPLVRKMVAEHGLDLQQIPGTGSAGRVTKSDVLSFLESGAAVPASAPAAGPAPWSRGVGSASSPPITWCCRAESRRTSTR